MIEASAQWLMAGGFNSINPEKISNLSNLSNPENPLILTNQGSDNVLLNTERLKFIDEISRLILELKEQFPKLAQYLSKAMDNFSANQENIPIKILTNLLTQIQQNLNKPIAVEPETVKNLVDEVIKILQPSKEAPPEYKLVLALSKNDFASANIAIKNIVQAAVIPQQIQVPPQTQAPRQTQIPLQTQTPQQIQVPQQTQVPQQIQVPQQTQTPQPIQVPQQTQIPLQTQTPLQIQAPQQTQIPQQIQPPQQTQTPQQIQIPLQTQIPQAAATAMQTFQTIFNALQELKEFGIPIELKNAPLKELETIVLQKTGIELDKNLPNLRDLQNFFYEKPTYATISLLPAKQAVHFENVASVVEIPLPKDFPVQKIFSNILQTPPPIIPQQPQQQQQPIPQTQPQPQQSIPQQPQQQPIPQQPIPQQPIPQQPQQQPVPQPQPQQQFIPQQPQPQPQPQQQPIPQKIEMAFSLHQITIPQNTTPSQNTPPPAPKFILQPWPVSTLIPKEERAFWQKTDLPLTPQILNIRETILSFGKLPENPEVVKLFANNLHEMSLQTEQGTYVSKEQANLLWRVVQLNCQLPTANSELSTLNLQLLKYQPVGNYEGELFKNLPEPVRRELQRELPAGKTWQPEILQKAVEKILEKYEEPQLSKTTQNEHTSKHSEEIRHILQNLKEQIQWTRIDQDTRLQNDRENVFYFMHEGNLQKGRLKIKDERKGSSKKHQASSISFSIETKTKNLGDVHADLTLSKSVLNIRLQDSVGTAGETVQAERETLAKELADIGITLGELLYGKIPKVRNLHINKPEEKKNSGLDIRA